MPAASPKGLPEKAKPAMEWTPSLNLKLLKLSRKYLFNWEMVSTKLVEKQIKKISDKKKNNDIKAFFTSEKCRKQYAIQDAKRSKPRKTRISREVIESCGKDMKVSDSTSDLELKNAGGSVYKKTALKTVSKSPGQAPTENSSWKLLKEFDANLKIHRARMKVEETEVFNRLANTLGISEQELSEASEELKERNSNMENEITDCDESFRRHSLASATQELKNNPNSDIAVLGNNVEFIDSRKSTDRVNTSKLHKKCKEQEKAALNALGLELNLNVSASGIDNTHCFPPKPPRGLSRLVDERNGRVLDELLQNVVLSPPHSPRSYSASNLKQGKNQESFPIDSSREPSELAEVLNILAIAAVGKRMENSSSSTKNTSKNTNLGNTLSDESQQIQSLSGTKLNTKKNKSNSNLPSGNDLCSSDTIELKQNVADSVASAVVSSAAHDLETLLEVTGLGNNGTDSDRIISEVHRKIASCVNDTNIDKDILKKLYAAEKMNSRS